MVNSKIRGLLLSLAQGPSLFPIQFQRVGGHLIRFWDLERHRPVSQGQGSCPNTYEGASYRRRGQGDDGDRNLSSRATGQCCYPRGSGVYNSWPKKKILGPSNQMKFALLDLDLLGNGYPFFILISFFWNLYVQMTPVLNCILELQNLSGFIVS